MSIFEAVDKQLGLKLVEQKRPVSVLVIDHIEETADRELISNHRRQSDGRQTDRVSMGELVQKSSWEVAVYLAVSPPARKRDVSKWLLTPVEESTDSMTLFLPGGSCAKTSSFLTHES